MKPKLCVIAIASAIERGFTKFRESCTRQGIEPVILGMGKHYRHNIQKIRYLHEFLISRSTDYSHILLCDSYDVIFAAGSDSILEAYFSLESPLVFSAERNCFPKRELANRYGQSSTPYRFLNAGLWMGEVGAAAKLVKSLLDVSAYRCKCDQHACTKAFLSGLFPIVLDHECRLFQSLYKSEADLEWNDGERRLRNVLTGRSPMVFHGNGASNMHFVLSCLGFLPSVEESLISAMRFGLMSENQYRFIIELITSAANCKTLAIGTRQDSELWYHHSKGNILCVEDRRAWRPQLPCRMICPRFRGNVGKWLEHVPVPGQIRRSPWDIVIIDGPSGCSPNEPGRQEPISWASTLTNGTVLVHDFERPWENQLCKHYLGEPFQLVPFGNVNHRVLAAFDRAKPVV